MKASKRGVNTNWANLSQPSTRIPDEARHYGGEDWNINVPKKQKRERSAHACNLCRARKVKCDNQKPKCGFCARNGRDCLYSPSTAPDKQGVETGSQSVESRVESRLQSVESRLQSVESRLQSVESRVESRLQSVESRLQIFESRLQIVESRLQGFDSRLQGAESLLLSRVGTDSNGCYLISLDNNQYTGNTVGPIAWTQ